MVPDGQEIQLPPISRGWRESSLPKSQGPEDSEASISSEKKKWLKMTNKKLKVGLLAIILVQDFFLGDVWVLLPETFEDDIRCSFSSTIMLVLWRIHFQEIW